LHILNDVSYIQADTYTIFTRLIKLGLKDFYSNSLEKEMHLWKVEVLYASVFNITKYSYFYTRCYRIINGLLKPLYPDLYKILHVKPASPFVLLLY